MTKADYETHSLAMLELQLFVAAFFRRFRATIADSLKPADMLMTDGFSGGPAGKILPLHLHERLMDN